MVATRSKAARYSLAKESVTSFFDKYQWREKPFERAQRIVLSTGTRSKVPCLSDANLVGSNLVTPRAVCVHCPTYHVEKDSCDCERSILE